jgi:serine/threonine protein phosphatase 1
MVWHFRKDGRTASTAAGERVYAIGDIHGRHDLFQSLVRKIIAHWESGPREAEAVQLVLLGDIIDRGADSAACLNLANKLVTESGVRLLKGNHEDLLLNTIDGSAIAQDIWLDHGGLAFLESFGIAPPRPDEDSFDFGERLGGALPGHLVAMLRAAPLTFRSGDYLFVHAGVRPGIAIDRQDEQDLLFIREDFTRSDRDHGAMIVHGHSIVEEVEFHPNRIAIDTGAFASERLSCVCFDGTERETLHT